MTTPDYDDPEPDDFNDDRRAFDFDPDEEEPWDEQRGAPEWSDAELDED